MLRAILDFIVVAAITAACFVSPVTADPGGWTLESATRHVLEVAPEIRAAGAEVQARAGELTQAGSWPNPTIDLRADDRLGQEDGRGGTDFFDAQTRYVELVARSQEAQAELRLAAGQSLLMEVQP